MLDLQRLWVVYFTIKEHQVRHFYLRDKTGFPVACVASAISTRDGEYAITETKQRLKGPGFVAFTISILNPLDLKLNKFKRNIGRDIAVGRLKARKQVIIIPVQPLSVKRDICKMLADNAILYTQSIPGQDPAYTGALHIPKRVREAAALWLGRAKK